jgi:hypothetical protein
MKNKQVCAVLPSSPVRELTEGEKLAALLSVAAASQIVFSREQTAYN